MYEFNHEFEVQSEIITRMIFYSTFQYQQPIKNYLTNADNTFRILSIIHHYRHNLSNSHLILINI